MSDDEERLDRLLSALADRTRRTILDRLKARPGLTVGELAAGFPMSRVAVMKHLAALERAGLVLGERDGRSRRLFVNPEPIHALVERFSSEWATGWSRRLARLRAQVEEPGEPET